MARSNAWWRIRRRRRASSRCSSDSSCATCRGVHCSTIDASRPQSCATWKSGHARSTVVGGCRTRKLIPKPVAELRQRALEGELLRRVVERRPLEQQAHREISAQRDREIASRDAVGPLFNLPHDAGPAAQGEQFRAEIVGVLGPHGHRAGRASVRSNRAHGVQRTGPRPRCPAAFAPSGRTVLPATSGRSRESSHGCPDPAPASTSARGLDRGSQRGIE